MQTDEPQTDVRPRQVKVIHFSSGETLTEEDSEEEEEEQLHQTSSCASEPGNWAWKDYSRIWGTLMLRKSLRFCDFLGEKMAGLLGLNAAKYQYAIDHHRDQKNETGGEVSSTNTRVNAEKISLSKIANKPYGATNTPEAKRRPILEETRQYKGEQNEGYNSVE